MAQILDTLALTDYTPYANALSALATLRSTQADLAGAVGTAQSNYDSAVTAADGAEERFINGELTAEQRDTLLSAVTTTQAALVSAQNDLAVCDEMVFHAVETCRSASYGAEQAGVATIASEFQTVAAEVATAHAALVTAIEAVGVYLATLTTKMTGSYSAHGVVDRLNGHLKTIAGVNSKTVETTLQRLLVADLKTMPLTLAGKHADPAL